MADKYGENVESNWVEKDANLNATYYLKTSSVSLIAAPDTWF